MQRIFSVTGLLRALVFATILGFASGRADAQRITQADVDLMCGRLSQIIGTSFPDKGEVDTLVNTMQPDGSWKDIDYLNVDISVWPPGAHLSRVGELARAYQVKASPLYHNPKLGEAVHRSLDFWLRGNMTSQNWWMNDIGIPNTLCDLFILLRGETTETELLQALNQMRGTYIDQTGQNRVWRAEIQLKIGLITFAKGRTNLLGSPEERIVGSSKVFQQEIEVRSDEGIQPDWSFHQHGVQQQFGNYGMSFATTLSRWGWVLQGTPVAYAPEKMGVLRHYILKGLATVVFKGVMDISGCGRQLFPNSPETKGATVARVLGVMEKADPAHAATYRAYQALVEGKPSDAQFPGNIYFYRSDLLVHRNADFYSSVRLCSRRIQSTESGNGENLLGYHLSDGATYLYQSGREYQDIFPVWNWRHIPGVTAYSELPLPPLSWGGLHNGTDFVGGVTDSLSATVAFLFDRDGLRAHKGWFYTGKGLVCLGAGITSSQNTTVSTTLNQSLLNGQISLKTSSGAKTLRLGQRYDGGNVKWVYHDATGYLFLENSQVHVSADKQTGSWKRIHKQVKQEPIDKDVFNLWVDEGEAPRGASYAYMIVPGVKAGDMAGLARKPSVEIIQNDTTLQAVGVPAAGVTEAIFYEPGRVALDRKTVLTADAPCMVIARRGAGTLTLTVAVPPEMSQAVTLGVQGHYSGENVSYDAASGISSWKVPSPAGMYAGSSVTVTLDAR